MCRTRPDRMEKNGTYGNHSARDPDSGFVRRVGSGPYWIARKVFLAGYEVG